MDRAKLKGMVDRWVRPEIRGISAYHVPESRGLVKLDAMENPYVWPEEIRSEWLDTLRGVEINRYPHPQSPTVQAGLRETMPIPAGAAVVLGNGSDELIQMIAMAVGGPGRTVLSVEPSFVMYAMIARFTGMDYVGVPLGEATFALDTEALLAAMARHRPAVVFLAYPNNPTGNLFPEEAIERVIAAAPGLVVVDEAYAPFTDASFMDRLGRFENLLVMRTVSKMGLAGLRLGLLAGPPEWIREIDKVRLPYNINVLTQASVAFALKHMELFEHQTREIRAARGALFEALAALPGLQPFPSEANFILTRCAAGRAAEIHAGLIEKGVLVKNLHGSHPLLADMLRITVGRPEENRRFLEALAEIL